MESTRGHLLHSTQQPVLEPSHAANGLIPVELCTPDDLCHVLPPFGSISGLSELPNVRYSWLFHPMIRIASISVSRLFPLNFTVRLSLRRIVDDSGKTGRSWSERTDAVPTDVLHTPGGFNHAQSGTPHGLYAGREPSPSREPPTARLANTTALQASHLIAPRSALLPLLLATHLS